MLAGFGKAIQQPTGKECKGKERKKTHGHCRFVPTFEPWPATPLDENLREDVKNLRRSLIVIWCLFLFLLTTLHLALGILRCPTR